MSSGSAALAFNGSFVRDQMGDMLKLFSYFVLAIVFIYAKFCLRQFRMFRSDFYTLSLEALLGIMLLISANNLIMVYLGLELLALASYTLVAYDRDSRRGSEAAMKYFVLGAASSAILLYGISLVYGALGTLDLAAIRETLAAVPATNPMLVLGMVLVIVGAMALIGFIDNFVGVIAGEAGLWQFHAYRGVVSLPLILGVGWALGIRIWPRRGLAVAGRSEQDELAERAP